MKNIETSKFAVSGHSIGFIYAGFFVVYIAMLQNLIHCMFDLKSFLFA